MDSGEGAFEWCYEHEGHCRGCGVLEVRLRNLQAGPTSLVRGEESLIKSYGPIPTLRVLYGHSSTALD